jgi:integrase
MSVCIRADGTIFVNWSESGKKKRKYFGKDLKAMAEAVRFNVSITLPPAPQQLQGPVFTELVNAYLAAKVASMSTVSMDNLVYKLQGVILPALGDLEVMRMNFATIDDYIAVRARKVKHTTIHRELSDVRAILRWAVRRQLIPRNPIEGFEMPRRDDAQILPLAQGEIEAIIAHSPEHLRRAMLLSFFCGLRPGAVELLSIRYNQVNWSAMSITIISARKGGLVRREIPIHGSLPLRQWFEDDGADPARHIITWQGQPVQKIARAFTRAKKAAGVGGRKIPMYALRHAFVSSLIRLGVDIRTIADMAGHDVATMLKHYAHGMDETRRNAISMLPDMHPVGAQSEDENKKG